MPYPDSEYPYILRGRSKSAVARMLLQHQSMLNTLRDIARMQYSYSYQQSCNLIDMARRAVSVGEGRADD